MHLQTSGKRAILTVHLIEIVQALRDGTLSLAKLVKNLRTISPLFQGENNTQPFVSYETC